MTGFDDSKCCATCCVILLRQCCSPPKPPWSRIQRMSPTCHPSRVDKPQTTQLPVTHINIQYARQQSFGIYDQYPLCFQARDFYWLVKTVGMSQSQLVCSHDRGIPPTSCCQCCIPTVQYVLVLCKYIHYSMCVRTIRRAAVVLINVAEKYFPLVYSRHLHHLMSGLLL